MRRCAGILLAESRSGAKIGKWKEIERSPTSSVEVPMFDPLWQKEDFTHRVKELWPYAQKGKGPERLFVAPCRFTGDVRVVFIAKACNEPRSPDVRDVVSRLVRGLDDFETVRGPLIEMFTSFFGARLIAVDSPNAAGQPVLAIGFSFTSVVSLGWRWKEFLRIPCRCGRSWNTRFGKKFFERIGDRRRLAPLQNAGRRFGSPFKGIEL